MNIFSNANIVSFLDIFIRYIIYFAVAVGTWLAVYPLLFPIIKKKRRFKINNEKDEEKNELFNHIEMIVSVIFGSNSQFIVNSFYAISIILGVFTLVIMKSVNFPIYYMLIGTMCAALLPYVFLRIKLNSIRVEASYEADELVTELINQYRINHLNMQEAISKTAEKLSKERYVQKTLFKVATNLVSYQNSKQLKKIIYDFTFSIDTQWAIQLGNSFFMAIEYGDDVIEALEDILEDLKTLNKLNAKYKQLNSESVLMIKYIAPFSYVISVGMLFVIFHFTIAKFVSYQFRDPMGLKFFLLSMLFIVINFMIYLKIRKPKNDF